MECVFLSSKINTLVNEIEKKDKTSDEELLSYLRELDINTLNRLVIIFNENKGITLIQAFAAALAGATLINALFGFVSLLSDSFIIFKVIVLWFFALIATIWALSAVKISGKKRIIRQSSKFLFKQKILTFINYILQEKLNDIN